MNDHAIWVNNLSKRYRIGKSIEHTNGRGKLVKKIYSPFQYLVGTLREPSDDEVLWALHDISFHAVTGEVLGIIGRNGAGKSTLLKILSRITEPTRGKAVINGRVGSLLEVGTGFHPELTGRENIYLNGAILGMNKHEIDKKFDEIVDFAEIEKFIDTPVKRYSSGMYVRLGFAVAAHLETEILMIDEVLAVGDVAFQKKCLGKMGDIAGQDRTILFVSHNMGAITNLCDRAMMLENGKITAVGHTNDVVLRYLETVNVRGQGEAYLRGNNSSDAFFKRIAIVNRDGEYSQVVPLQSEFKIQFEYQVTSFIPELEVSFSLFDKNNSKIFHSSLSHTPSINNQDHPPGHYIAEAKIPGNFIAPGTYTITAGLYRLNVCNYDRRDHVVEFTIANDGAKDYMHTEDIGSIIIDLPWNFRNV